MLRSELSMWHSLVSRQHLLDGTMEGRGAAGGKEPQKVGTGPGGGRRKRFNWQQRWWEKTGAEANRKAEVRRELGGEHQSWGTWEVPTSEGGG